MLLNIFKLLLKGCFYVFEIFSILLISFILYVIFSSQLTPPVVENIPVPKRTKVDVNHFKIRNNWLKKNKFGIWEMYIEGDAYERGLIYGVLSKELVQYQEKVFVNQIDSFVPSSFWQQVIRMLIGFFNKDLLYNIPEENLKEIYGVSQSFSDKYDYIGTKYQRILNYHAAHDIGHALNDYSVVGCTSFGLKKDKTSDGQLLLGRNFDFYVGDEFAKEKLVLFVKPSKGIPFVSYSWAGFTGVASGLNNNGLSVTINASKSDLPTSSKTPISILAREILQYATTIDQAIKIAKKRNVFVSETLMISSKRDNRIVLIEKAPKKMGVYESKNNTIVCANHYQSSTFKNDEINITNIKNSDSHYRFERLTKLLKVKREFDVNDVAKILRDQKGLSNDTLGMGNPRAINQLIAHHSVIIQPNKLLFYVSSKNFQLGEYIGYDLNTIFNNKKFTKHSIKADPFLFSQQFKNYKKFRIIKKSISNYLIFNRPLNLTILEIEEFIKMNSESYLTYEMLGKYFYKKNDFKAAFSYFNNALTKKTASKQVDDELKEAIKDCLEKQENSY